MAICEQVWAETHDDQTSTIGFLVQGPTMVEDVSAVLMANIPPAYDYRVVNRVESIDLVPGHYDLWLCKIRYAMYLERRELKTGEMEFKFATSGQQARRTISISSRVFEGASGVPVSPPPEDAQLIGYNPVTNSAEGVTVDETSYSFGWIVMVPFSTATESFRRQLGELRGTVNATPFFGYPAGEVKFEDHNGGVRSGADYRWELQFSRRKNQATLSVGGVTVTNVTGWEYIDAECQEFVVDPVTNFRIPKVSRVKVHQVYPLANWGVLSTLLGV